MLLSKEMYLVLCLSLAAGGLALWVHNAILKARIAKLRDLIKTHDDLESPIGAAPNYSEMGREYLDWLDAAEIEFIQTQRERDAVAELREKGKI